MKCIAIIPARIGSKSIKKKNLIKINGISLIEKTIHSLKKNKFLSCIAVSTDSKEIQKVAKKNNVWCEKLRPKNISGDKSTANDAVKFVIKAIKNKYDFIFEVHPTYFFRNHLDLYKCFKKVKKQKLRNIISVSKVSSCAHKDYQTSIKGNKIKFNKLPHTFNKFLISNTYEFNGYIQGSKYEDFLKYKCHFGSSKSSGFIEIKNKKTLLDLNDIQDLKIMRKIAS